MKKQKLITKNAKGDDDRPKARKTAPVKEKRSSNIRHNNYLSDDEDDDDFDLPLREEEEDYDEDDD